MPTNEEQIPYYNSSLLERYLNYIAGSSDVIPSEVDSRLAEYLRYLCLNGTIKEQQIVSQLLPLKADLVDGKVPSTQLPSYVSEIVEVETYADLPEEGDANVIYVVRSPSTATYRWTGTQYIALDEQGQYFSVKVSSTNITTMAELRTYITNINNYGMHCFFDFSDFITNGYICTTLMFSQSSVNYCVIFDVINGRTYIDYAGYEDTDTVQNYVSRTGDNIPRVISISDNTTTIQDVATILTNVNVVGHHIMFDFSGIQSGCYLCTVSINSSSYKICDTVNMRIATGTFTSSTTLASALSSLFAVRGHWKGTQSEYDALGVYSDDVDYDIIEDAQQA